MMTYLTRRWNPSSRNVWTLCFCLKARFEKTTMNRLHHQAVFVVVVARERLLVFLLFVSIIMRAKALIFYSPNNFMRRSTFRLQSSLSSSSCSRKRIRPIIGNMMMSSNSKDVGTHIPHPSQHPSPLLLRTLAPGSHLSELEIKKSRFLGYATSVTNWKVAQAYLISLQQEHPKARHWCFGYYAVLVAGGGGGSTAPEERSSDDGEPTGTAGLPILGTLQSR